MFGGKLGGNVGLIGDLVGVNAFFVGFLVGRFVAVGANGFLVGFIVGRFVAVGFTLCGLDRVARTELDIRLMLSLASKQNMATCTVPALPTSNSKVCTVFETPTRAVPTAFEAHQLLTVVNVDCGSEMVLSLHTT